MFRLEKSLPAAVYRVPVKFWADSAAGLRPAQASCCSRFEAVSWRGLKWQRQLNHRSVSAMDSEVRGPACWTPYADKNSLSRRKAAQQPPQRRHS